MELCKAEKSLKEIAQYFGYSDVYKFKNNYINDKLTIVLPHPSPLNIKWFKKHPEFDNKVEYFYRADANEGVRRLNYLYMNSEK